MAHFSRRTVLTAATAVVATSGVHAREWAPDRPVRIIVPVQGSTNDLLARMIGAKLQDAFKQGFVVENKPGAGGNIGADFVAKSPGDGLTLLTGYNGPLAVNVTLFPKLPFDPLKDLAPITLAVKAPQYLVTHPQSGISSARDLVARAKAMPDKHSYASIGMGSASHLTMEMFKTAAGFQATHIPYKGATPAVTALLAGEVDAAFLVPGNVLPFVKEGRLKLLASSGVKRFASTPDVPTIQELGYPGFEATSWIGFLAPGSTPKAIINRYNREIVKALNMPDVRKQLQEMEYEVVAGSPEQFSAWIRAEITRWGQVIKATGAKAE